MLNQRDYQMILTCEKDYLEPPLERDDKEDIDND